MNIEDILSRTPVFLDSNHFHKCELIIKIFTGLCKCPHESMIKPNEIQLNQEWKPFYIFQKEVYYRNREGFSEVADEHKCSMAAL